MPSWVKSKKDTFSVALPPKNIDISTFTDMQAHAYNMINAHSEQASQKIRCYSFAHYTLHSNMVFIFAVSSLYK